MSWFAELAGKAESLLVNFDEQTGAALRNHNGPRRKNERKDFYLQTDPPWMQKKRPIPRTWKKVPPATESKNNFSVGKSSPTRQASQSPIRGDNARSASPKPKKLSKKSSPLYTLNNCPKTMVGDMKDSEFGMHHHGLKQRRSSLPNDLDTANHDEWIYKIQNVEIENVMLRNELNVLNQEVTGLLDRLRKTEDGNDVDPVVSSGTELNNTQNKLETSSIQNGSIQVENEALSSKLQQLKQKIIDLTNVEMKYKEQNQSMETEVCLLKDKNKEMEEKLEELTTNSKENETAKLKLESELRHGQSTIKELQSNLEKSKSECVRLEKEWETYKLRVKSMLHSKDNEIKALQEGLNLNEDTQILMEQLETLKEERDVLSETTSRVRTECDEMKTYVSQLEGRLNSAERVVSALRDALRDERGARNRVEAQCAVLNKELKNLQLETGQTIASLRTALRDKDSELSHLRESSTSVRTTDTSALNVADYDVTRDSIDSEKIHVLTQTLVQKQGKIDSLLADNNILKIQLDKLENKYKSEIAALRSNAHSVIHLQDTDYRVRPRSQVPDSTLSALSMRIGIMIKRYPIFRLFIFVYMIGLHFWVLTVLLSSTPEDHVTRPTKA